MTKSNKINYLEYPAKDLAATKIFFTQVFNWQFTDYGPDYIAFVEKSGLNGGFYRSPLISNSANGAGLTVFYTMEIAALELKIVQAGGKISTPLFAFPGGVRFHFTEPSGNEFAVWSES
ncbi:VOC family protein [uncultured Psychromonas sp.]|uniref:VOC family protein n=1 Tax=uncultured Psychromonas sp. TaxID=173974 RepID=UPI0026332F07|nr:VOC family protein [uncultured Psychromonas sp.]